MCCAAGHDCGRDGHRSGVRRVRGRHNELHQLPGVHLRLWVYAVAADERHDGAHIDQASAGAHSDRRAGLIGPVDNVVSASAASLIRQVRALHEVHAQSAAHHAFIELRANLAAWGEQALERVDQLQVVVRGQQAIAVVIRGQGVLQLLAATSHVCQRDGSGGVIARLIDILDDGGQHIGFDGGRENRHGGFDDARREIVQAHRQVLRREVEVNALDGCDLQGRRGLRGVLRGHVDAGTHRVLIRQANLERVADLRAVFGERGVILLVDRTEERALGVQDAKCLAGNGGGRQN